MILKGFNNNNSDVLEYCHTLRDAKNIILQNYKNSQDVFILMLKGPYFAEGFHQYTLELIKGKFKKNTRM
jgi:hypothetical protein